MSLAETKDADDVVWDVEGFSFLLDSRAKVYLTEGTIDYQESILGEGFSIKSKLAGTC